MTHITRNGKRWNVNECIQLQREFELLQLSVSEIAIRHKRTPNAIMFKLDQEGFANYNVLYSNHQDLNTTEITNKYQDDDDDNYDDDEEQQEQQEEQEYTPENDDDDDDDNDDEEQQEEQEYTPKNDEDNDDLKTHFLRLEKQVMALTDMFMKSSKNNSVFSLFA